MAKARNDGLMRIGGRHVPQSVISHKGADQCPQLGASGRSIDTGPNVALRWKADGVLSGRRSRGPRDCGCCHAFGNVIICPLKLGMSHNVVSRGR
jgi:hypothetical protein